MIRTLKKLKTWYRFKQKKRKNHALQQTNHSCHCCSCSTCHPQPTAPPLPPWADFEKSQEAASHSFTEPGVFPPRSTAQWELPPVLSAQVPSEIAPLYVPLPVGSASYQQYLVPSPTYGVPIQPLASREEDSRFWGCVTGVAARLSRCLCTCWP
ncbi:hypothetical protein COCNU_contig69392027G000010 [Cocos nucifera]|nr:hypothetical protein [Cocos nucifera]